MVHQMGVGDVRSIISTSEKLRIGINLANGLLVSKVATNGEPIGVAPDIGRMLANEMGLTCDFVCYENPGEVARAVGAGTCDLALIAAEAERERSIAFSDPYAEIEVTFLVRPQFANSSPSELDRSDVRIASYGGAAYDLWLAKNFRRAHRVIAESADGSIQTFEDKRLEAVAGLRMFLATQLDRLPGTQLLPSNLYRVQQAIGLPRSKIYAIPALNKFIERVISDRTVHTLVEKHGVSELRMLEN